MPSNNSKYSEEMRNQTVEYILDSGKSATSMAEELGIDTGTPFATGCVLIPKLILVLL